MRLIDRSIRPLFPDGFKQEVQVHARAYGFDGENNADVLAMIAGFASLHISPIPFACALGATRIAHVDGEFVGGCDIVCEMHESGELGPVLENVAERASSDAEASKPSD